MSHEFWCWRCETLELVKFSILDLDKVRGPGDFDVMPCAVFQHIFGVLPKPGQAIQIDPSEYLRDCPKNHKQTHPDFCDVACGDEIPEACEKLQLHARIVSVKNLEEGK